MAVFWAEMGVAYLEINKHTKVYKCVFDILWLLNRGDYLIEVTV